MKGIFRISVRVLFIMSNLQQFRLKPSHQSEVSLIRSQLTSTNTAVRAVYFSNLIIIILPLIPALSELLSYDQINIIS